MCRNCEDKELRMDDMRNSVMNLVKLLYSFDPLNIIDVEKNLDNLCHVLQIPPGIGDIQIQRMENYATKWQY